MSISADITPNYEVKIKKEPEEQNDDGSPRFIKDQNE